MGFAMIKKKAHDLFEKAHFISHIDNEDDYENALVLMDELIEDYDYNRPLIEVLAVSIERWEDKSKEFSDFNARIKSLDSGRAILKILMEQHRLGVDDLPEIGSKSLISKIINNKRQLTLAHIQALRKKFKIDPALFF
ncbi:MAG: transcriptional regulator [Gammaproteobacteria bacterium]|nr:transcriptional regulator [Gammaproteobacteria bacterium]